MSGSVKPLDGVCFSRDLVISGYSSTTVTLSSPFPTQNLKIDLITTSLNTIRKTSGAVTDFKRQNLTSIDVRF